MFGRLPVRPPSPEPISEEQQITLLSENFPIMKELLTCPPSLVLELVKKLSEMEEESKKSIRKFPPTQLHYWNKLLLKQLKRVSDWKIDHKALYYQLKSINSILYLAIQQIYEILLFSKIENGMVFT